MQPSINKPLFAFPDIPESDLFSFEKLTNENFAQLYLMFEGDDSPFTDQHFKSYNGSKEYVAFRETYGAYSAKHGGQDWLFRIKEIGAYAGILHLYDLSLETFFENNKRCWIGFAIKPEFRRKGIMKKALTLFATYVLDSYPEIAYLHSMTAKENFPAQRLLLSCDFKKDETERLSQHHIFFLKERE